MIRNTVVIDRDGEQLVVYSGDLEQIKVGQPEFFIGQTNYEVLSVEVVEGERIVTVGPDG